MSIFEPIQYKGYNKDLISEIDLNKYMKLRRTLLPDKIKSSGYYQNHLSSNVIDGDLTNSYWCDKRPIASLHFLWKNNILFDGIEVYYYMKSNESRTYVMNLYTCDTDDNYYNSSELYGDSGTNLDYELIRGNMTNNGFTEEKFNISNFDIINESMIRLNLLDNLLFMFKRTSSRKNLYAIRQIMVKGTYLNEVTIK